MKNAAQKTATVPAAEFKAKCLQLMDEVQNNNLRLVITKRGKPVVEIAPPKPDEKPFRSIIGRGRGARITGDIVGPVSEDNEWNVLKGKWKPS